jgi:hypothetical protein
MSPRKKLISALGAIEILIAVAAVLVPWLVFPPCESHGNCHYSFIAEIGVAAIVFISGIMIVLSKGVEAPRLLSVVSSVCGVFMILFPSALIGVCESPMMACRYGALPVWNLLGGLLVIVSIAVFFSAKEEDS